MEQYKRIQQAIRNKFKWYSDIENIDLKEEEIVSDFLRYWLHDGISTMAFNQVNQEYFRKNIPIPESKDLEWYEQEYLPNIKEYYYSFKSNDDNTGFVKIPPKKSIETPSQQATINYYSAYNNFCTKAETSIRYIIKNFKNLTEFGFLEKNNPPTPELYKKLLRFAINENVYNIQTYCKNELKSMGLDQNGQPLKPKKKAKGGI